MFSISNLQQSGEWYNLLSFILSCADNLKTWKAAWKRKYDCMLLPCHVRVFEYIWWWLAHPTLLRHHMHLVYFLFKAANFQIRHLLTFWWRFLRHSGPVRLSAYIRPMITWYLFFNLIGHWSCDMWPHLAQWWCPILTEQV